jgi:hypothetical protein
LNRENDGLVIYWSSPLLFSKTLIITKQLGNATVKMTDRDSTKPTNAETNTLITLTHMTALAVTGQTNKKKILAGKQLSRTHRSTGTLKQAAAGARVRGRPAAFCRVCLAA